FLFGKQDLFDWNRRHEGKLRRTAGSVHARNAHFLFPNFFAAGAFSFLNSRVRFVSEASTPMRSSELAPTKPTASVFWITRFASSGVLIGPPWQRKKISFRTRVAASMISCVRLSVKSQLTSAFFTPMLPPRVVPT